MMYVEDAQMVMDEGRYKLRVYGCKRTIVIHRWHAYTVTQEKDLLVIRDDIDRVLCVTTAYPVIWG